MPKQKPKYLVPSLAILALLLNIGMPGLGSIAGNKVSEGAKQLALLGLGAIGIYLDWITILTGGVVVSAWIWALLTSIELLKEAYGSQDVKRG